MISKITILATLLGLTASAWANPFFIGRFDGLKAGPVNQSAFAAYWNPAGLTAVGTRLQLHTLGVNRHATFHRYADANNVPESLASTNAGSNTTGSIGVVPSIAIAHGLERGEFRLGIGAAAFIDRAGRTDWRKQYSAPAEFPGAIDGPQRWSTINTSLLILSSGIGFGLEYRPWGLSVGVTPVYNYTTLTTVRARNPDGGERVIDESGRLAEGRILFENGAGHAIYWIAGIRWAPNDKWAVGLAWHGNASYEIEGDARITFGRAEEAKAKAAFDLPVPHTLRLESAFRLTESLTLRPQYAWMQWSIFERQQAINADNGEVVLSQERFFNDVQAFKLAVDWLATKAVTLHFSAQFETNATPIRTFEPGLAESENWEFGLGLSLPLSESLALGASFTWQQFADVEVSNSVQKPTMNGAYTDRRQYVTIDLEVQL